MSYFITRKISEPCQQDQNNPEQKKNYKKNI